MKKDKIVERIYYHDGTNEIVLIRTYPNDEITSHFLFADGQVGTTKDDITADILKASGLTYVGHYEFSHAHEADSNVIWLT